jgi:hypothetical protein
MAKLNKNRKHLRMPSFYLEHTFSKKSNKKYMMKEISSVLLTLINKLLLNGKE